MCPVCMTTTALVAAGTTSGAGVLGFVAVKFRWLQRLRHHTVLNWIRRKPMSIGIGIASHVRVAGRVARGPA
jgi:hypothetical protein